MVNTARKKLTSFGIFGILLTQEKYRIPHEKKIILIYSMVAKPVFGTGFRTSFEI